MSVTLIAQIKVKAGSDAKFEEAARKMAEGVRANEPGTQQYVFLKSVKDPTNFFVYEVYQDQAALDAHGKSAHMKEFSGAIGSLVDGRATLNFLQEVARK